MRIPILRPALLAALLVAGIVSLAMAGPLPEPRPPAAIPAEEISRPPAPPLPRARPADRAETDGASAEAAPQPAADPAPPAADSGDEAACRRRLTALGVGFKEMEPIDGDGACGAAAPIEVNRVAPSISLTPAAILNCRTAEALATWTQKVVVPAAERHLDAAPTGLIHASSYVCRSRNNRPGAKLSEHATANAVDIAGIAFEEREAVAIAARGDDEAAERAFQRAIRKGACEHFTTVLGPGSDAAHATHFHLDLAQRKRGFRLCQ